MKSVKYITIIFFLIFLLKNLSFSQSTKTTVSDGFWSNPLVWDNGIPQSGDNVIINHTLEIDLKDTVTDIAINDITILYDTIFIKGVLNIESDISGGVLFFINNSVDKGRLGATSEGELLSEVVWQKWIERCDGWGMYGGPFEVSISDYGFFHTGVLGSSFPSFWTNTYIYDETISDVDRNIGWTIPGNINDILPRGHSIYLFDSSTTSITESFNIQLNGFVDLTENFDYRPNYSGVNNSDENGWNLVSNPFLGTIDWDAPGWKKISVQNAIWVLDNCTNLYSSYVNGVGVNGGNSLISSGQGFWIKGTKSNVQLKSDRRVIVDDLVEIKSNNLNKIIRLSLEGDEIALVLNSDANLFFDTLYDAIKFKTYNSTLYSKLDKEYSINSFDSINSVPIWVKGDGYLHVDLNDYDNSVSIFLEDIVSGNIISLNNNCSYYFTNTSTAFTHRFNVIFDIITSNNEIEYTKNLRLKNIDIIGRETNKNHPAISVKLK